MTSLDQAMRKVFERRDQPPVERLTETEPTKVTTDKIEALNTMRVVSSTVEPVDGARRELFVDAPEKRLRGFHRPPTEHKSKPTQPAPPTPTVSDDPASFGDVMNSLLSYELAVTGPALDSWPLGDVSTLSTSESNTVSQGREEPASSARSVSTQPFKPAWETDAFRLTTICREIPSRLQISLHLAVAELMENVTAERPVVSVSGMRSGAGSTTVSIVLARALAKAGLKAIVIDGDDSGDDSPLADQLGVAIEGGWNSIMAAGLDAAECCVQSLADGFCLLSLDRTDQPPRAATVRDLTPLLRRLVGNFDVVLVDCGGQQSAPNHMPGDLLGARIVIRDLRTDDRAADDRPDSTLLAPAPCSVLVVENFASTLTF